MRTVIINETKWFAASDLLRALGCKPPVSKLVRCIRETMGEKHITKQVITDRRGRDQETILISSEAVQYALQRTRSIAAKTIAQELGLELNLLVTPVESDTIEVIARSFKHLQPVKQFFIVGYRIDLYFPVQRIAVECDELHHQDQLLADKKRQAKITNALDCIWIRYRPGEPGFNVGDVISNLMSLLYV